ncbi:V-type ATP synthase subunit F [Eubacterium aggregans]|uniref:V-type ATP synthase subunit F n=1 Tax=Eubacterium aggregans TaxID=81409 RepID=UPI003F2B403D
MKAYIISENRDSFLGMKLAGIQGIYVRDAVDIERAFKGALKNPEIGIIYLTEKAYLKIEDLVLESKRKNLFPLITIIPDRYGYERQQGVITQYIKESVGL